MTDDRQVGPSVKGLPCIEGPNLDVTLSTAQTPLGVPGYTFADLHDLARLASLDDRFNEEVQAADPALWRDWDAYRSAPDAPRSPVALSNLLIAMARQVSRFITRLFDIEPETRALDAATRAQDDLFRFKVDFVRRRALPLLKSGAQVTVSAEDEAIVARLVAEAGARNGPSGGGHDGRNEHRRDAGVQDVDSGADVRDDVPSIRLQPDLDLELTIARAGCALMDREKEVSSLKSQVSSLKGQDSHLTTQVESLKRWCAARIHDPAYRHWVIFRFPETLDYWRLVDVQRPMPERPEVMVGPDWRLRPRDGFKLTDARMAPREILSEIHYCGMCHDRDKDSCCNGLL